MQLCTGAGVRAAGPGRDAGADARSQGLRSGHGLGRLPGRGLPRARGAAGRSLGALPETRSRRFRRTRTRNCTPAAWSRSAASTASTRTRSPPISPAVAMARDAGARPRVHFPRPRAEIGRQPGGPDAGADRGGALGHVEARPAAVPATGEGRVAEAMKGRAEIQARRTTQRAPSRRQRHGHWKRG